MALRQLMLQKELEEKRAALAEVEKMDYSAREAQLAEAIDEVKSEEDRAAVESAISAFEEEKAETESRKGNLEGRIAEIEEELAKLERADGQKREGGNFGRMEERQLQLTPRINREAFNRVGMERAMQMLNAAETRAFVEKMAEAMREKRDIENLNLTIPEVILPLLRENVFDYSKLLRRVNRVVVNGEARQIVAGTVPEAVWTEMCANINELSWGFTQIMLDGYKEAGYIPVCNAVLEDSYIDMAAEIITMLGQSLGLALDKAILYGRSDANQFMPMGIVTRLAQTAQPSGYPTNAPAWIDLHSTNLITIQGTTTGAEFFQALVGAVAETATPYARGPLFWAMNSKTYNKVISNATAIDATGAIVSRIGGVMPIVGGDIDVLEFMPDGDIVGGYGLLYTLGERAGVRIESSIHAQWIQDNTVFRATARYDGAPAIANAFIGVNINGAAPTTVMNFAPDTNNFSAELSALSIASATLSPVFSAKTTTYTASTTAASGAITATPADPNATVTIYVNGKGAASNTPTWNEGENLVLVRVKNGLNMQNYTVTVTKSSAESTSLQSRAAAKTAAK